MTDHDDDHDRTWFRAAVDPTLDAHPVADRWAELERHRELEPPLVVSLVPRPPRRPRRWVLAAAVAVVVLVAGAVALSIGDDGDDPTAAPPATTAPTTTTFPPTTTPSTPTTEGPTTTTTTTTTVPPGPLVEVPEVQRRIDLASFGLDVRYLDRANPEVAEGAVVSQDPAPGTEVPEGSLVVVIMSGGGPVMAFEELPPEAQAFTESLPDYRATEPIRRIPTGRGEAYKTDAWLFGPCPAVDDAALTVLDPSYDTRCY
ncbi:hypothetical protein BH24ACT4_BH24ACT4_21940 [soil metagenome]